MSRLAEEARESLLGGDLERYGRIMIDNNECQRALADGIIPPEADVVIRLARKHGASGWKVNGAGGPGGSLTLLAGADVSDAHALDLEIEALGRGYPPYPGGPLLGRGQVSTFKLFGPPSREASDRAIT